VGVYLRSAAATVGDTNQALATPVTFTAFTPASPAVVGKPALILKRTLGRTFGAEARARDRFQSLFGYQHLAHCSWGIGTSAMAIC
jgi:hypothetical protein